MRIFAKNHFSKCEFWQRIIFANAYFGNCARGNLSRVNFARSNFEKGNLLEVTFAMGNFSRGDFVRGNFVMVNFVFKLLITILLWFLYCLRNRFFNHHYCIKQSTYPKLWTGLRHCSLLVNTDGTCTLHHVPLKPHYTSCPF